MDIIRIFVRNVDRLSAIVGIAISAALPVMVCVLTVEVVARYIFDSPTIWAFDTATFLFGYCGLLAGAYVHRRREHINVDIFYGRLSPRWQAVLDTLTGLIFFFFIILVIVYGWKEAYPALASGERRPSEWAPLVGHFKMMVPVGAFLLLLQGFANWLRSLYLAVTGKELTT